MKAKRILINGALLILSTLVSVVAAGLIYRVGFVETNWHDANTRFDSELGWSPFAGRSTTDEEWGSITSNSLGFRSPEIDPAKDLLVLLGDSVAWGWGVSDDETMSHFLEQRVHPIGYQVQNLGVSGYGIDQYYLTLKRHAGQLRQLKKVVLVIFTGNDLRDTATNSLWGKRKPLFVVKGDDLVPIHKDISKYCLRNVLSIGGANFLQRQTPILDRFFARLTGDIEVDERDAKLTAIRLIAEIRQIVEQSGATLTVVLSPASDGVSGVDDTHRWFRDTMAGAGYDFVDLYASLFGSESEHQLAPLVFLDWAHYSPLGNRSVANVIYEHLFPDVQP